jgi:tetratricopeptide (TPR) repeat protein
VTRLLLIWICFSCSVTSFSQLNSNSRQGNTYAVVIGISRYDSADIPALKYSSRDAAEFATYLQSKAGGSVPPENMLVLLDSNANTAAVYNALYWLMNQCGKDDLAYIYFAGHGDMENTTLYKLGFLLTSNTGPNNYINNSLRIEDLNNFANTLSAERKSKVVIITDACHSGKLAEKHNRAAFLVGDQLRSVKANEVRITACETDQLSNEDEGWGGGRGVFSYYLLNGLKGLADRQKDGIITTEEIKNYLDSSFAHDAILKENNLLQTPGLESKNKSFPLALVDSASLHSLRQQIQETALKVQSLIIPEQPFDYFFKLAQGNNILERLNYDQLLILPSDSIAFSVIGQVALSLDSGAEKLSALNKRLEKNEGLLRRFNSNLAEALHEKGQRVINLYLKADEPELERRRYYNNSSYDVYPKMFSLALKLTDRNNYLYKILEVNKYYFTGVVARLKIPTVTNANELIKEAFAAQLKAYDLEKNAAYIHNELGVLYQRTKDFKKAVWHFREATSIAPEWVVPQANLMGIYSSQGQYAKAEEAYLKAKALQPGFQGIYVNAGLLNERKGNYLLAEETYRNATFMNSRHFLPYERLGFVYMKLTQYALADSFFHEAELRKLGYHFDKPSLTPDNYDLSQVLSPSFPCDLDTASIKEEDVISMLIWAFQENQYGHFSNAEKLYKQLIKKDKNNFLAFHQLARILYHQQRWQEAELLFTFSADAYMDSTSFNKYCDSLSAFLGGETSFLRECLYNKFKSFYFASNENHYFLGELYSNWNHFDEAVSRYKSLIHSEPSFIGAYNKLWRLYEKFQRYPQAEATIQSWKERDADAGRRELLAFYRRMTSLFPDEQAWYYKAGAFLYELAASNPNGYVYDTQAIEPDSDGKNIIKGQVPVTEAGYSKYEYHIPGTWEVIQLADQIFKPRTEAILFLMKADSLSMADETLHMEINDKIGDLYTWLHLPEKANLFYQVAADMQPYNAGTKMKLVATYTSTWNYSNALQLLDSLYRFKQINFSNQLQMAKFYIHAGQFKKGETVLAEAKSIYPYQLPIFGELTGLSHFMAGNPLQALPYYLALLKENEKNPLLLYTIASLYAQSGKKDIAWKYLEKAVDSGFHYGYVLRYDVPAKRFEKNPKWEALIGRFPLQE